MPFSTDNINICSPNALSNYLYYPATPLINESHFDTYLLYIYMRQFKYFFRIYFDLSCVTLDMLSLCVSVSILQN